MRDPGLLSDCLVENSGVAEAPSRRRRSRALILSVLIQSALLATILILPIFNPGVIRARYSFVPLPPYHGGSVDPANAQHASPRPLRDPRPIRDHLPLYQPPTIPAHTLNARDEDAPNGDPPVIGYGVGSGEGPGVEFGIGSSILMPTAIPPKPPEQPRVIRQSEGVQEAQLIRRIDPVYPPGAVAMRMSGTVRLRAVIATDGAVSQLDVVSGNTILARAAMDAVRQWRYHPTLLNGTAVEVETDITVIFQLAH
jgi:protein TonB